VWRAKLQVQPLRVPRASRRVSRRNRGGSTLKRCPECAREIEESATACETCAQWAAALVGPSTDAPSAPVEDQSIPAPSVASEGPTPRKGRRELLIAGVAVAAGALVTIALFMGRGGTSSNVVAAAPAPATPPSQPAAPERSVVVATQKWTTATRAYWLGNQRRGAAFELPAENIVQTWFGPVRPSLVVRCSARTTQAFVYTGSPMKIEPQAEGKSVTVGLDSEPMKTERWPDSDDHDALFAPDGAAFAGRLVHAQTLRFGYSPHNANDVVAQFHVTGLAELIEPVAKECGWAK
jgi:hypothetical protein